MKLAIIAAAAATFAAVQAQAAAPTCVELLGLLDDAENSLAQAVVGAAEMASEAGVDGTAGSGRNNLNNTTALGRAATIQMKAMEASLYSLCAVTAARQPQQAG